MILCITVSWSSNHWSLIWVRKHLIGPSTGLMQLPLPRDEDPWRISSESGGGQTASDGWSYNEPTNWLLTDMRNMFHTHTHTRTSAARVPGEPSILVVLSESVKVQVPNTAADRSDQAEGWLQTPGGAEGISRRSRRSRTWPGPGLEPAEPRFTEDEPINQSIDQSVRRSGRFSIPSSRGR